MRYNDFKKYFINNIYSNYMQGDIGMARTSIARIYRDGKDNPRATIYRTYSCLNETYNLYKTQKNLYIISSKRAMAIEHQEKYLNFVKDVTMPEHVMVKQQYDELYANLKTIYPSSKSHKFMNFIILKQKFPFLKHMKFLTKFL